MVVVTSTWSSFSAISKQSDYMQYYIMLLEQCGHIVAKVQATVTWLNEDQIQVCLVTWLDYSFAFTLNCFHPLSPTLSRLLKEYVLHCTRYWPDVNKELGVCIDWNVHGYTFRHPKKLQNHKASVLVYKNSERNCAVEQWTFGLQWFCQNSSRRCQFVDILQEDQKKARFLEV